jgi:hypothetical protein
MAVILPRIDRPARAIFVPAAAAATAAGGHHAAMVLPMAGPARDGQGPSGYTYGAVLIRLDGAPAGRAEVLAALREMRFSGWLARPERGWLVAVARSGAGTVAAGRRGVLGVAGRLAERFAATVLAVRVVADRQLLLALWADGEEAGRYVSDPSAEPGAEDDVLSGALGVEHAAALAAACGRPEAADDLAGLLAEDLDPDSVIESERLSGVLRLLGLPRWLVAAPALPRDVPTGPGRRDVTRLGAGVTGPLGPLCGWAAGLVRRRRPPPPAVTDPPRGGSDMDPWLM